MYNGLITAIPSKWKKMLQEDANVLNYYVFVDHTININNVNRKLIEINTKDLYWHFINDIAERPTSETTWEAEVGLNFDKHDWELVYTNPYTLTRDTRLIMFQYKINYRILACKYKLHIWKIEDNDTCDICNTEPDIIEHHLVACPKTREFWQPFLTGLNQLWEQCSQPTPTILSSEFQTQIMKHSSRS